MNAYTLVLEERIRELKNELRGFKRLQKEFEQYKRESIKWSWEDFTGEARAQGYRISKAKAQEALEEMIKRHDAGVGISWETVYCYVQIYGTKLKKK